MHSSSKVSQAITLRKAGKSVDFIAKRLRISKSTASLWVAPVSLSKEQKEKLRASSKNAGKAAFKRAAQKRHEQHKQNIREARTQGKKDVPPLSTQDMHLVGLGLYWGEGYKKGSEELGFTNSDPRMIAFFLQWMYSFFSVKSTDIILRVSINAVHTRREKEVLAFWSKTTGIPLSQFTKTSFIKTIQQKKYLNKDIHYGTLRVKVRRGSTLRARILASIAALKLK